MGAAALEPLRSVKLVKAQSTLIGAKAVPLTSDEHELGKGETAQVARLPGCQVGNSESLYAAGPELNK
jgi:hypothetical protein